MASAHCAAEVRRRDGEASILLVGREPGPPAERPPPCTGDKRGGGRERDPRYERPPLSKEYMRGESKREDAFVHAADWYEQNDVEVLTGGSVMALDGGARTGTLQTKGEVEFARAVIATGARVN